MGNILRSPKTSRGILLTPRSGSHSLAVAALKHFWPNIVIITEDCHPAGLFPVQETYTGTQNDLAIVVRNPIERFRSMCAHKPERTLEEHLANPMYGPLPQGPFAKYFRFEDQLNDAAEWLGLPTPLLHEDATNEADKPTLTPEQEARVREIYADDIVLWESLQ
jgi:hypothetical protein